MGVAPGHRLACSAAVESLIPLVLIFFFMWFLLIRPQQQRVRAQRSMLQALEVGDEIVTAGGICGRITAMTDEQVTVDVGNGTEIRFVRAAIRQVVEPEPPAEAATVEEDQP